MNFQYRVLGTQVLSRCRVGDVFRTETHPGTFMKTDAYHTGTREWTVVDLQTGMLIRLPVTTPVRRVHLLSVG